MNQYNKTLMATVLKVPVDIWKNNCFYLFILNIPFIFVTLTFGVILAMVVDGLVFSGDE